MFGMGNPRSDALFDLLADHRSPAPTVAQPPQPIAEAAHVVLRQPAMATRQENEAEKDSRRTGLRYMRLLGVQAQAAAFEEAGDAPAPLIELPRVVVEQDEVVHVAQVSFRPQHFLAEVVQAVQIEIGEELARQVADREPSSSLEGSEEIVARVVEVNRLLGIGSVDDAIRRAPGCLRRRFAGGGHV